MEEKPKFKWWWPDVSSVDAAGRAVKQGMWAAVFVAFVTALFASYALGSGKMVAGFVDASAFIDSVIFAIVAIGLYKQSRIAAIAGLAIFLFEKIVQFTMAPVATGGIFMAIILTLCFIGAVRGTNALHKLRSAQAG